MREIPGRPLCTPGPAVTVPLVAGQAGSGRVYYSAEVQDHEGQAEKTFESEQNEGAQMSLSNELERESERYHDGGDRAMVAI